MGGRISSFHHAVVIPVLVRLTGRPYAIDKCIGANSAGTFFL